MLGEKSFLSGPKARNYKPAIGKKSSHHYLILAAGDLLDVWWPVEWR
jgi:hypothetical protein